MDLLEMWWLSLGIFAAVVVVVAVLLGLVVAAAKRIDRHAAAIWSVGKQIAGNTVSVWMLDQTNRLLRETRRELRRVEEAAGGLAGTLQEIAGASRRS